jgi:hypothetical protein
MAKVVETPEEKVEIIEQNLQSLKKKMKDHDGRKKYGYHFRMLKKARQRVFIEAQKPLNSYSMK